MGDRPVRQPLVTVAISFFNNEGVLGDAIVSVLNQGFPDWELILIDGGSSDRSLDVARKFTDERIKIVAEGPYKSFVECLNQSTSLASGKYYARMDSDDVMHPERLEVQARFLEEHPDVHVVDTGMYSMTQEGKLTGERSPAAPAEWTLGAILAGRALNHATAMGRIEWFRSHPYDPSYLRAEDLELWCRTAGRSVFARVARPLYYVREGKVSIPNYRKSQATSRRIFRQYGPQSLTPAEIRLLVMKSHLKSWLYTVMGWLGMQDLLTQARNRELEPSVLVEARRMLLAGLKRQS